MSKYDKNVMVIPTENINEFGFEGFAYKKDISGLDSILDSKYEAKRRGDMEQDTSYKQAIPYGVIYNPEINKIYVYKRAGSEKNGEERLDNKISVGVGGHVDVDDTHSNGLLILDEAMKRELEEEVSIKNKNLEIFGYINDNTDDVGLYHLGVVYLIKTIDTDIIPVDGEIVSGEFVTIGELEDMSRDIKYDMESWSRILIDYLKKELV